MQDAFIKIISLVITNVFNQVLTKYLLEQCAGLCPSLVIIYLNDVLCNVYNNLQYFDDDVLTLKLCLICYSQMLYIFV